MAEAGTGEMGLQPAVAAAVGDAWPRTIEAFVRRAVRLGKSINGGDIAIAACGAKGLGKSTFLRELEARLVAVCPPGAPEAERVEVVVLETDLGQPERGVPGVVSLRRAGLPAGVAPDEALFIGDVTPSKHPLIYMEACRELARRYNARVSGVHGRVLLVNTHGWNVGVGATMVAEICAAAAVSHAVHLVHPTRTDSIALDPSIKVTKLQGHVRGAAFPPAQARFERLQRYFSAKSLSDLELKRPVVVRAADVKLCYSVDAIEAYDFASGPRDTQLSVFESCLVGICRSSAYAGRFEWVAAGLVRSVDLVAGELHIITPFSAAELAERGADAIVLGTQASPLAKWRDLEKDDITVWLKRPFFVEAHCSIGIAAEVGVNRRNLKRRRLVNRDNSPAK